MTWIVALLWMVGLVVTIYGLVHVARQLVQLSRHRETLRLTRNQLDQLIRDHTTRTHDA
jgi:hypothetical protein